ncbi:MAG: crossover junction endodeoxyribonuclease RuvC [Solirubrobacterales bacterium]
MGIDPGLANTGFGVVSVDAMRMVAIDAGTVEAPGGPRLERRLGQIHEEIGELLDQHCPSALALEDLYFGKNVRSAMGVGQARGVVMLAAAQRGIPCFDYTPQAVKKSVCGSGSAEKDQVKRMVATLLSLAVEPSSDHAADALAVAICHASQSYGPVAEAEREASAAAAGAR